MSLERIRSLVESNPGQASEAEYTLVHDVMLPRKISFVPVCDGATVLGHVDSNRLRDLPRANPDQPRTNRDQPKPRHPAC